MRGGGLLKPPKPGVEPWGLAERGLKDGTTNPPLKKCVRGEKKGWKEKERNLEITVVLSNPLRKGGVNKKGLSKKHPKGTGNPKTVFCWGSKKRKKGGTREKNPQGGFASLGGEKKKHNLMTLATSTGGTPS